MIESLNNKEYVQRNDTVFERRVINPINLMDIDELNSNNRKRNNCLFTCGSTNDVIDYTSIELAILDTSFYADCFVNLSHGKTAYRFIEPNDCLEQEEADYLPLTILLHGMYNFSYMWADLTDLLTDSQVGPKSRVLILDFYGHGRSPWDGVQLSLDIYVSQVKEVVDYLGLNNTPASIIGYDLGGAVAAGYAAKYPTICAGLIFMSPIGIRYRDIKKEKLLQSKYIGEYIIRKRRYEIASMQQDDYYNTSTDAQHRIYIDKQMDAVRWQIEHTPGYLGAVLSTIRKFPLRLMDELYIAIGRHRRPVLVLLGDKDVVCPYVLCMNKCMSFFPSASIIDVRDCGHNIIAEKLDESGNEIICFLHEMYKKK